MWLRNRALAEVDVVAACEALLSGTYVEFLEHRDRVVPVWAWTNLLAHGSDDELSAAQSSRHPRGRRNDLWRAARAYLAGEVLGSVSLLNPLGRIQADVLVPLEQSLMSDVDVASWRPRQWVTAVLVVMEPRRQSRTSG
jgi:hypothetical protein